MIMICTYQRYSSLNAKNERFLTVSDKRGNVQSISYNSTLQVVYTYDKDGNVLTVSDKVSGEEAENTYDSLGNLVTYTRGDYTENYAYDAYGKVAEYAQGTRTYLYSYKNNSERDLDHITVEGITVTPETDVLGRNKGKEISGANGKIAGEYLYYRKVGDHATNMPSAVYFGGVQNGRYVIRDNMKYEYDRRGNICKIFENGALSVRYEYDSIDRLTREDNKNLGFTVLFAYDNCGNIISRRQTSFTLKTDVEECSFEETLYSYDGDKLLSFGAEACEYDVIGNPTTYRGKTVSWTKGRQMTAYDGNTFAYDGQGRRIAKNSVTYTYDGSGRLIASGNGLEYLYDTTGIFAVKYNNATYFYRKDAQGNIIALLDNAGNIVVNYIYDVWGNHAVLDANGADITDPNHIGGLNPFRYRGYFYDSETGLYYLQTRYYDPEIGRFITIDGIEYLDPETINGLNLYAYCGNNPVMNVDSIGTDWNSFWSDVGNWFNKAGNRIKDFFVEDVYGKIIKPTWNWISGVAAPSVSNFFVNTIPTFFNTTLPNWWNKIKMTVGQWTWKEIINPMWNFIVQTVPNSLASAWNWISNNWKTVVDVASGALSIGSGIVGILAAVGVFSIPVVGQIILGIVSIGGGIYSMGSAFSWWCVCLTSPEHF